MYQDPTERETGIGRFSCEIEDYRKERRYEAIEFGSNLGGYPHKSFQQPSPLVDEEMTPGILKWNN